MSLVCKTNLGCPLTAFDSQVPQKAAMSMRFFAAAEAVEGQVDFNGNLDQLEDKLKDAIEKATESR
jgi:hypothetical protein